HCRRAAQPVLPRLHNCELRARWVISEDSRSRPWQGLHRPRAPGLLRAPELSLSELAACEARASRTRIGGALLRSQSFIARRGFESFLNRDGHASPTEAFPPAAAENAEGLS